MKAFLPLPQLLVTILTQNELRGVSQGVLCTKEEGNHLP